MLKHRFVWRVAAVAMFAWGGPAGWAGDCDGTPGWTLDGPGSVPIGETAEVRLGGPADAIGFFMLSLGEGPIDSSFGKICLDFPLVLGMLFRFDGSGRFDVSGDIPCDRALVGLTLYMQFVTGRPNKGASNQESLTITDGVCAGDLCTFTQDEWGDACKDGNAGCRRDSLFDAIFPNGVTIGDVDGVDGDGDYALVFRSAAAVEQFLPATQPPDVLDADATDPTTLLNSGCRHRGDVR
jgi:hypothetical protein